MFSDNEMISLRQFKRVAVFDLFSVSWLIIPRIAVATTGRDGLSAIIVGIIIALIYTAFLVYLTKFMENNFLDYSVQNLGSILTFIIGALYFIKLFICCIFVTRLFGEVIKETLLEDTDTRLIILILLLVSAYAASKGFEVRARISEILYYIVLVPILAFTIMGIRKVNISNLMPIFTENPLSILNGGYTVFITFTMLELLLFSVPLVRQEKENIQKENTQNANMQKENTQKERKLFRYIMQAILIVGVLDLLFFIVTVGILGINETKAKLWSTITIIQSVPLPGGFIQRQDALILGIWMLSIFTVISGFIYYLSFFTKHMVHGSSHKFYIIFIMLLLFGASAVPIDLEKYYEYFEVYMKNIGMPQSIIIPIIVVLIGKLRGKSKIKAVRSILIVFTFLSVTSLTGCKDMTEIEDRNFVQAMGIDLKDDKITVYYVLPDLPALTGQGPTESEKLILQLEGEDFFEIEEQNRLQSDKRLDFSHIKAIILGNDFANDKKQLEEFLLYVENKYELGRNTLVFLAKENAKDIISLNGTLTGGVGEYLNKLYRINLLDAGKEEVIIGNLITGKNNDNLVVRVPILEPSEKLVKNVGLGLFVNNEYVLSVSEQEENYINLANGLGKNSRLFIGEQPSISNVKKEEAKTAEVKVDEAKAAEEAKSKEEANTEEKSNSGNSDKEGKKDEEAAKSEEGSSTDDGKGTSKNEINTEEKTKSQNINAKYVIKLNNVSRKIEFYQKDNKPYMILQINGYGIIQKGGLDSNHTSKSEKVSMINKIQSECNQQILDELNTNFNDIMKARSIDFLNLYRLTSYKDKNLWLKYEKDPSQFIKDLQYTIEVNIQLK